MWAGPASPVGPLLGLRPHLGGAREKNGDTPVSPPWTRCPKPFCSTSSHCYRCEKGGLSPSTDSCVSPVLGWDLNPGVLKGPTPCRLVLGKCLSVQPIYDFWLEGAGCLYPLSGYIPSSHSTPGRGLLSPTADCTSELVTDPCWLPSFPSARTGEPAPVRRKPHSQILDLSPSWSVVSPVQIRS